MFSDAVGLLIKKDACLCHLKAGTAVVVCGSCGGVREAYPPRIAFIQGVAAGIETLTKGLPWWKRLFKTFRIEIQEGWDGEIVTKID